MPELLPGEKYYTIFWLNGDKEYVCGSSAGHAMANAGHESGEIFKIDFIAVGINEEFVWTGTCWARKSETLAYREYLAGPVDPRD